MKVNIIGAGITGMFASYYLKKDGHDVTLIDKTPPIALTSIYNAGEIAPTFGSTEGTSPLVSFWHLTSTLLRPRGPIYISPKQVVQNLKWFRIGTKKGMAGYEDVLRPFAFKSFLLYKEFFEKESIAVDSIDGLAALYTSAESARKAAAKLKGRFIDNREVSEMGFLNLEGGVIIEGDFSINPYKMFYGLKRRLEELGVDFQSASEVKLVADGRRVTSVSLDGRKVAADAHVVSAGANCRDLLSPLGFNPQILPAVGRVLIFDTGGATITKQPAMLADFGTSVIQHNQSTFRATSFFELRGFNSSFPASRKKWLLDTMSRHLQNYGQLREIEEGVGYRPCSPDQIPVIGLVPGYENVYVASGNCRVGLTLAPATAYLIKSLIGGAEPLDIPWRQFDPSRFAHTN